jgi:hypothetical protein
MICCKVKRLGGSLPKSVQSAEPQAFKPKLGATAQNATANIVIFSETAAIFGRKN